MSRAFIFSFLATKRYLCDVVQVSCFASLLELCLSTEKEYSLLSAVWCVGFCFVFVVVFNYFLSAVAWLNEQEK